MFKPTLAESTYRNRNITSNTNNGLRHGDALAFLLIVLEKVMKYPRIQTTGHIFNRLVQILACVDEKNDITRTRQNVIQAFTTFKTAAERMCLKICKLGEK